MTKVSGSLTCVIEAAKDDISLVLSPKVRIGRNYETKGRQDKKLARHFSTSDFDFVLLFVKHLGTLNPWLTRISLIRDFKTVQLLA